MENKSNYSSLLSSRAQKEIEICWEWYEERQQGLGDRFISEVILRIRDIEKMPDRHPTRYKAYKEALVPIFPFLIIYRIIKTKKYIRIVSVFHSSRNPKKKYS